MFLTAELIRLDAPRSDRPPALPHTRSLACLKKSQNWQQDGGRSSCHAK